MKKLILPFLLLAVTLGVSAQRHELRVGMNTGYSFFRGESSESSTFVNGHGDELAYTNSPLGKKFTPSFGVAVNYKYLLRNFILGAEVGYEDLRTKVHLDSYSTVPSYSSHYDPNVPSEGEADGRTIMNNHFLNGHPFIGYRFRFGGVSLDLTGGVDLAYVLSAKEKARYKDENGKKFKFSKDRDSYTDFDVRPRIQASLNYKRYTCFAGASFGLSNYYKDWTGGSPEAYLNTIRIGIQYQLF